MEILINNSKFKLTEINCRSINDKSQNKDLLESFNYISKGVILGPNSNVNNWDYKRFDSILENINLFNRPVPETNRIFIIEKCKLNNTNHKYKEEELCIMSGVCQALIREHSSKLSVYKKLEIIEGFVRAIGRAKPIMHFYTIGSQLSQTYNNLCESLNTTNLFKDEIIDTDTLSFPLYREGKRYSIYELVDDLIKDNSFILDTNNFKLISPISINKTLETSRMSDEWCRILGKTGNKKRANLSINFLANICAEIPENNVGIEPGKLHLTSPRKICIVKDGLIINSNITVKINSKELQRKLKKVNIIKERLLYDNELTLNLSSLPIINRNKLKINIFDVAQTEANYTFSSMACNYLEKLIYMRDKKLTSCPKKITKEKSDKEKYLESLGIYNTTLHSEEVHTDSNAKYIVNEVTGSLESIPKYYSDNIYCYCHKLKCPTIISDFLKNIDNKLKSVSLDDLYKDYKEKYKIYEKKLRDLKFKMLLGRTLNFKCFSSSKKQDFSLYKNKIEVPIEGTKIKVGWKFNTKNMYFYDINN
jgi:hypothetical protein